MEKKDKFLLEIENNYRLYKKDGTDQTLADVNIVIIPGRNFLE
jgi:hypothetical protein